MCRVAGGPGGRTVQIVQHFGIADGEPGHDRVRRRGDAGGPALGERLVGRGGGGRRDRCGAAGAHMTQHGAEAAGGGHRRRGWWPPGQGSSPQILRPGQSQNRGGRTPKSFAAQALRHRRVCAMVALKDP